MKKMACLVAILGIALFACESYAQNVTVHTRGPLGLRQHTTTVNFAGNPAYVNHQVLVDPNFRRAQLADVNSFTYTPVHSAANLRFRDRGTVYLHQPPITAAPIIEQYTRSAPGVYTAPRGGCSTCPPDAGPVSPTTDPGTGGLYYSTPPSTLTAPAPDTCQRQGLSAAPGYGADPRGFAAAPSGCRHGVRTYVDPNATRAFLATPGYSGVRTVTVDQRYVRTRQFLATNPGYVHSRQFVAAPYVNRTRVFLGNPNVSVDVRRGFLPFHRGVAVRAPGVNVDVRRGFLGPRVSVRAPGANVHVGPRGFVHHR